MTAAEVQQIFSYHDATKHHPHRYARSLGYMDWKNQPNPFRLYDGCGRIRLPLEGRDPIVSYENMYRRETIPPAPFTLETIGGFLALSLGLSAWKSIEGAKWALRMNPSSGNLHPTEAHLVLPDLPGVKGGVYHYAPLLHALELRAVVPETTWDNIHAAMGGQGFFVGLTSIFWREAWKYGERAYRYCNHDVGHALAAISLSAALHGWRLTCLAGQSDPQIETVLGLNQTIWAPPDAEHPDLLCFVFKGDAKPAPRALPDRLMGEFSALKFSGTPNRLSASHHPWEAITRAAAAARKRHPHEEEASPVLHASPAAPRSASGKTAAEIIRQRRSGVSFEGKAIFPKEAFFSLLAQTLPREHTPPFDAYVLTPSVDLLLFVHRVQGLQPGLYFLSRVPGLFHQIKDAGRSDFLWAQVREGFPLYLLSQRNVAYEAIEVSCHQEIAGQSCFSLGMIAFFREHIETAPYRYRSLFWETGMIGQVLYLEAEAHGFRGTGIGCFFDDVVHRLMGFEDNRFQSLYHFTIGTPIDDSRLTTLPAYHHLQSPELSKAAFLQDP